MARPSTVSAAWLIALVVACGSDPDPHEILACKGWTDNMGNPFTGQCERACEKVPQTVGKMCDTVKASPCNATPYGDLFGCCLPEDPTLGPIRYYECVNAAH
jgi:hypothetical protein